MKTSGGKNEMLEKPHPRKGNKFGSSDRTRIADCDFEVIIL